MSMSVKAYPLAPSNRRRDAPAPGYFAGLKPARQYLSVTPSTRQGPNEARERNGMPASCPDREATAGTTGTKPALPMRMKQSSPRRMVPLHHSTSRDVLATGSAMSTSVLSFSQQRGHGFLRGGPTARKHSFASGPSSYSSSSSSAPSDTSFNGDEFYSEVEEPRSGTSDDEAPHRNIASRHAMRSSEGEHSDDGSESDIASDASSSSDRAAEILWHRLEAHREKIRALRRQIYGSRKQLKSLRNQFTETDNAFMALMRRVVYASQPVPGSIQPLKNQVIVRRFEEMQDIRTRQNEAESRLEELENELEKEERSHEETEIRFFSHIYRDSAREIEQKSEPDKRSLPPSRSSLLGISDTRTVDTHPLYERLLSAVGDRESAKEQYEDLVMERDDILYETELQLMIEKKRDLEGRTDKAAPPPQLVPVITEEQLDRLKSELSNPRNIDKLLSKYILKRHQADFLRTYNHKEEVAKIRLDMATAEVHRLRALCIDQGVMPRHPSFYEEYAILVALGEPTDHLRHEDMTINEDYSLSGGGEEPSLAHHRFPLLLSNPKHVLKDFTTVTALKDAVSRSRNASDAVETQEAKAYLDDCVKEYSIETLMSESTEGNKGDYVNRWLFQRLRTSPLEALLLFTIYTMPSKTTTATSAPLIPTKVRNIGRWQHKVMWHWTRDEAATKPPEDYDGPVTSLDRDGLVPLGLLRFRRGGEGLKESGINSAARGPEEPSSSKSEAGQPLEARDLDLPPIQGARSVA